MLNPDELDRMASTLERVLDCVAVTISPGLRQIARNLRNEARERREENQRQRPLRRTQAEEIADAVVARVLEEIKNLIPEGQSKE